jgi:predicted Fe-Mo cluster-binding NifX family protein
MSHLVALTTTDGKTVTQHFGHCDAFHIVRIDGDSYEYVETREVDSACRAGGHSDAAFDAILETLQGVEAVVTAQIGPGAAEYVINHGLRIFEGRGFVDEILAAIINGHLLDTPGQS